MQNVSILIKKKNRNGKGSNKSITTFLVSATFS